MNQVQVEKKEVVQQLREVFAEQYKLDLTHNVRLRHLIDVAIHLGHYNLNEALFLLKKCEIDTYQDQGMQQELQIDPHTYLSWTTAKQALYLLNLSSEQIFMQSNHEQLSEQFVVLLYRSLGMVEELEVDIANQAGDALFIMDAFMQMSIK